MSILTAAIVVLLTAGAASGQVIATNLDQLPSLLEPGDEVYITGPVGPEARWTVVEVTPAALVVEANGVRRSLAQGDLHRISVGRPDPLLNGVLTGLVVAAGLGIAIGTADGCPKSDRRSVGCALAPGVSMGALGAALGAWIDAAQKAPVLIYEAPSAGGAAELRLFPIAANRGAGIGMVVTF